MSLSDMAKETENTMNISKIYLYKRSRKDKCGYNIPNLIGKVCTMQSIYHRYRQRKKLL